MMDFMIPTDRELKAAEKWWNRLPDTIKGKQSIWVILAMYAEHVLHHGRRRTDLEGSPPEGSEESPDHLN